MQAAADAHAAEQDQSGSHKAGTPASQPQAGDMRASPAERPSGASPASTASQRELLQQTQAANCVIPSQGLHSPSVPDVAYDDQNLFVAPGQNMPEMELQAEDIVRREDLDDAMEQDFAGERPAVALQVYRCMSAYRVSQTSLIALKLQVPRQAQDPRIEL